MPSSQGEGSNHLRGERLLVPAAPLTSLLRALPISISCDGESRDYKYSFLSLLFCFLPLRQSLILPGWSQMHCTAEAGLDSQASSLTVWVLGLQACTNIPRHEQPSLSVHIRVFRGTHVLETSGLHRVSFSTNLQFIFLRQDLTLCLDLTKLAGPAEAIFPLFPSAGTEGMGCNCASFLCKCWE